MGLMKKLTSAVVASSLVLGLVGTAAADFSPAGVNEAAARMQALGVVKGTVLPGGGVDLALNEKITRAQLVTILVRAFGKEADSQLLKGAPVFTDTSAHWASGEIAMAKAIIESKGHKLGVTETTFAPDKDVTSAEAIALVMKFLGVKADTTKTWPMDYIQGAVNAGLISEADKTALTVAPNSPAVRGLVFYLADHAFSTYTMPETKATVYGSYLDTKAPVITVDATFEPTTSEDQVTLSGTVTDNKKVAVLHVGSIDNAVAVDANGKWSTTVKLVAGENKVWIHALDIAGNAGVYEGVNITRVAGDAAKIEAQANLEVAAGASADVNFKVLDAKGVALEKSAAKVTVEGEIGTYDDATGKFTAAAKTGTGTLTITAGDQTATVNVTVTAGALADLEFTTEPATTNVSVGTPLKLVVKGKDANGNEVAVSGATFTATNGIVDANGNFAATVAGTAKVTATAGGLSKDLTITVYSTAAKLAINNTKSLVANAASEDTVTVNVQDANGFTVASYNGDVTLTVVGATGALDIKTGASTVADTYTVKAVNGVATFTVKSQAAATTATTARVQATSGSLTGALKDISIVKPVLTKFEASVDVSQIEANPAAGATVTVKAFDQEGVNTVAGDAYTVTFSSSNTDVLRINGAVSNSLDVAFANNDASKTFQVNATAVPGAASLTATIKNSSGTVITTVPVNTLSINTAIATAAAKLQVIGAENLSMAATATSTKTFKVALLDQAGNVLSSTANGATAPTIVVKDANGVDQSAKFTINQAGLTAGWVNGIYNVAIVPTAGSVSNAGTYTIEASRGSLTKSTGTLTLNPGTATYVTLTADNIAVAGDGISRVVLTAKVVDTKGNTVDFDGNITLKQTVGNDGTNLSAPATTTVAAVDGVATWTLTATNSFGTDSFGLEGDLNGDGTAEVLNQAAATPSAVSISTQLTGSATQLQIDSTFGAANGAGAKKAGESYEVKVYVRDAQATAKTVTADNGRPVTLVIKSGQGTVENATVTTVNGVATFKVSSTKGGTSSATTSALVFYAEASGLTKTADTSAYFTSGDKAKIVLSANTNLAVGSNTDLSANYVDQYGNYIAPDASLDLKNVQISGSAATLAGGGSTITDGAAVLNASSFPASGALTAEHDVNTGALPVDSLNLTVYNVGLAYRAQVQTVADKTADATTFTVKVALVDYNGLTLTNKEGATTLIPFDLKVTDNSGAVAAGGSIVADSYVDGVATYTYTMPATKNAGQYKFEAVVKTVNALTTAGYTADEANLLAALKVTSVTANVTPGSAVAVETAVINPADGTDVIRTANGDAAFNFDGSGANVAFVKVMAIDAKGNVVTSFSGQGKLVLSANTNLTLVGANSSNELLVTLTNGYGTAMIQRSGDSAGTITGSAILSGTTYTADATPTTLQ